MSIRSVIPSELSLPWFLLRLVTVCLWGVDDMLPVSLSMTIEPCLADITCLGNLRLSPSLRGHCARIYRRARCDENSFTTVI